MKDREYMSLALELARKAGEKGDVPVGAVIVLGDKIIGQGYNKREENKNALLHAEICAINDACETVSSWRLTDAVMYVTLEPCPMCAGAVINSRIGRVIFGAYDERGGCFGSLDNFADKGFNHKPHIIGGFMEEECAALLRDFFAEKR
ncbi:MAG: tRNA adenosine(34) deaminase TadA [Clostridia bacterium]|nr:tRNA adenosine(34) deaminase TadA [Clostridia bacterium]